MHGATRIAIDIGGTFTDVVLAQPDGSVSTRKVPSTPEDYANGIVQGATELLAASGVSPGALDDIVHATTVAANTILEGKGARTALVTTEGFRDVLEMRRLRIPTLYDLRYEKPPPLVPRRRRYEVRGRIGPDGQTWEELDDAAIRAVARHLRDDNVEAVAISLINAYADPGHELRVAEILREELGDGVYVSRSSDVLPEIREYERTSTTVVNAYIAPTVRRYLSSLVERLRAKAIDAPIRIMQSSGGTTTLTAAVRRPAHIIESGPAAGVIGCARLARQTQTANMISLDMGGTTAKTAMIEDGAPVITGEYEVGGGINVSSRLIKGGGYAVKLPYIDVSEIGAGGGSVIRVDEFGRIHVGPDSAGASPGPACYGRGGVDATLTDALVVLGYLDPAQLAGGDLAIHASLAEQALDAALAAPLGIGRTEAAYGALTLSVATMTRAVKAVSTYRGRDPREFTLCAFGGNGPVVGAAIAHELDIATVVIPPSPGVFSAAGLIHSGSEYQFSKSVPRSARAPSRSELHALYDELEAQVRAMVTDDGGEGGAMDVTRLADLRYAGQAFELTVPVDGGAPDPTMLAQRFQDEHRRTYGHASDDPVQLASLRVVARSGAGAPTAGNRDRARTVLHAPRTRQAYFGVHGALDTPVLERGELTRAPRRGPLIIQEYDATTVVPPGWSASLDDHANIALSRGESR
ncbi:MAG: hydantoinase/oxoprolinase family protein [Solirubrobacteraceae bacterium]